MLKKKALEFVLKNWKTILIVALLLVVVLKTRYDYHLMESAYTTMIESNKEQLQGLRSIHEQETREKQLLMESYLEEIASLEREYETTLKELDEKQERKTKEYSRKFSDDKEGLISDIEATLGLKYVSP
jgi:capsular polysaccharide biosynthesis protein